MSETQKTAAETAQELIKNSPLAKPPETVQKLPKPTSQHPESGRWPQMGDDGNWRDRNRNVFDPAKHRVDSSGKPMVSGKGYFKGIPAKLQGNPQPVPQPQKAAEEPAEETENRQPAEESAQAEHEPQTTSRHTLDLDPTSPEEQAEYEERKQAQIGDQQRACAKVVCETIYALGVGVGGVSCKPLPEHRESMESAWTEYFQAKEITDIPPGMMVVVATGSYVLHCAMQKEAQDRLRPWYTRLKEKIVGFFVRRRMRKEG